MEQNDAAEVTQHATRLLSRIDVSSEAKEEFLGLVYEHLREIARKRLSRERREHTLQPTALVHEAYMRLLGDQQLSWEEKDQFFIAASEAMRRILIDHSRRKNSARRGGGEKPTPMNVLELADDGDPELVAGLDDALTRLEKEDPRAGKVVRLRFYSGLSVEETAEIMRVSPRTVAREWAFARARLFQLLEERSE